ncbi:MAG: MBL fold metallo-hydrolase [Patescibacteria group bacterium]
MKIIKLGHCCLLIEEKRLRILTDPGSYTVEEQKSIKNIDVILITHEHTDHLHVESLKVVLQNNPNAKIFTNKGVGVLLEKAQIQYELLLHNQNKNVREILFEGFGEKHAEMYENLMRVDNTGYFISRKLFYPGDAFINPGKEIEVLALPVAGPWMKLSEAVNYAKQLKPKSCFPVHDGILKNIGSTDRIPAQVLPPLGIQFISLEIGKEYEF